MFQPSRDEARRFFFDAYAKYCRGEPLTSLERPAVEVILLHPEYHELLADADKSVALEFTPEHGRMNPFLHLSLHLAIEEQLSIDQPRGIRGRYENLLAKSGSEHEAKHAVLDCLGEVIWQAQRLGTAPDETAYLDCLARKAT
jgi:hypothetical protein